MQLHELKRKNKNKDQKRVGRGGKRGTYSGKGMKGQKSRAGARFEPVVRYLVKKYPKLRGYRYGSVSEKNKLEAVFNLPMLEKNFDSGEEVNPQVLIEKKLVRKMKGKVPEIKILGKGEITKNLNIKNCKVSDSARKKIEKAGGKIE